MNIETIRRLSLIAPTECNHFARLFIHETKGFGDGGNYREIVFVCAQCGQFFVLANKDGVDFDITFQLPTEELIEAAGKWHKYLEKAG